MTVRALSLREVETQGGQRAGYGKEVVFLSALLWARHGQFGLPQWGSVFPTYFLYVVCSVTSSMNRHHCKFINEDTGVWVSLPNPAKGACGGEWKYQKILSTV